MSKLLALAVLLAPQLAQAQVRADSGYFVTTLGRDTVAIERYVRSPTQLIVHALTRLPETRLVDLVVRWDERGRLLGYEHTSRAVPGTGGAAPVRTMAAVMGDSIRVETTLGASAPRLRSAPAPADVPLLNLIYSLYEVLIDRARPGRPASVDLLIPQGKLTYSAAWQDASVALSHPEGGTIRMAFDEQGRLIRYDGSLTTFKVSVNRTGAADIDGLARAFVRREAGTGALGTLSPRDTARATIEGATITIDYGRPAARGRVIFGSVVPWDQVWRTGANAATQLEISRDLVIDGQTVPAGKYSLWTVPGRSHWQLILNRQTGQWGTQYDAAQDFARIPIRARTTQNAVERFTITIERQGSGGVILLYWENTQALIPFTLR